MIRLFLSAVLLSVGACMAEVPQPKFVPQVIDDKITIGYGLALADVDGDSAMDIILADKTDIIWYQAPSWKKHVLASRLTLMDNVCVAARDIDDDGKAEIAVGAQWNPGETSDASKSGALFYLVRPTDPAAVTQPWKAVALPHEPTVHRMRWVRVTDKDPKLVVLPLHGRDNDPKTGDGGAAVKVIAYDFPKEAAKREDPAAWEMSVVDQSMRKTHNFDVRKSRAGGEYLFVGGREGIKVLHFANGVWKGEEQPIPETANGVGEVRGVGMQILTAIMPMHGNELAVFHADDAAGWTARTLTTDLGQGHALVCGSLLGRGFPEIVAGWREKNSKGKVGITLWVRSDDAGSAASEAEAESWQAFPLDENTMACEDLQMADLDNDGMMDLVASGRSTHNVIIYWNKSPAPKVLSLERAELPPLTEAEMKAAEARKKARQAAEETPAAPGK